MKQNLKHFASLQITITCLILGIILIFIGTLAQVSLGIHGATQEFFYALFVFKEINSLGLRIPVFPGGYLIGGVLLANLIAAFIYRFKLKWSKTGILLTHTGVILLLLGELVSSLFQVESFMRIDEGGSSRYSEVQRESELAIFDRSYSSETDRIVSIPQSRLYRNRTIESGKLPFSIAIDEYMPNSSTRRRRAGFQKASDSPNQGIGLQVEAIPEPLTAKDDEINIPSAQVTIADPSGNALGTWLTSWNFPPQEFRFDGRDYAIVLRPKRIYYPFSIELLDFSHDRYLGTNIPKNYSSLVKLKNQSIGEEREFLIYMNNPLRYQGHSFYQASFDNNDTTSIFQVVDNPGRLVPYISSGIITLGLLVQFLVSLTRFNNRERKAS